jgi:hypothetical protein
MGASQAPPNLWELHRTEQDDYNQQYEDNGSGLEQACHLTNLPWQGLYRFNQGEHTHDFRERRHRYGGRFQRAELTHK